MIANFFSKSTPARVFYLMVLLSLYYLMFLVSGNKLLMSLSNLFINISFWFVLVLFLLVFRFIVKKNKLTLDNLYALFLMVILMGSFGETMFYKNIIFSNLFLLFSFRKIYSLKSQINTKMKLFDAGLWVGVAAVVYSWSGLFLILIYVGLLIYQKGTFKNLCIPLVGFFIPLFLMYTYFFYFDNVDGFMSIMELNLSLDFTAYNNLKLLIPVVFLSTILLWSIIFETPRIVMVSNRLRQAWKVILSQLLISIIVVVVLPLKNGSEILYLLFPATIIIANYLSKTTLSNFRNLIMYVFMIISVGVYFL